MFNDQFHFTKDQNRHLATQNLTRLIYTESRFEGVTATLPQTQAILEGERVEEVSTDDIDVIVQLHHGWELVLNSDDPLDLNFAKQVNKIVAANDSLEPGGFRSGNGEVNTLDGVFVPEPVNIEQEKQFLGRLFTGEGTTTNKALTLMYHLMRNQIFWDGNKRTATLLANKYMIDHGAGLINVPLDKWGQWNQMISDYYHSGQMLAIKQWTYQSAVQGFELN